VKFRITLHSGFQAPEDALDQLFKRLGASRDGVRFAKLAGEIRATWGEDAPISMESDEREEIGRRDVLDIVREVCERTPELASDWFAVSALRR
jgi:hypothetical protein